MRCIGCRPGYLPILIAAVEAICDPLFRAQDAGSTPSWEPIVIVSGPGVRTLRFNTGPGLLKVGHQANTSVGRFLRLFLRNLAGLRPETGTDKGTIGFTFNVALAGHLEALVQVPAHWMNRSLADGGLTGTTLEGMVAAGTAPARFAESNDPDRMVPVFPRPEWIGIVVSGDADRNQSRFLINNHNQGVPVSKRTDW